LAAANGRGRANIGTRDPRVLFDTTTPTVEQRRVAAFTYVNAPAYYTLAAHVRRELRFGRYRASVQLNVSNLLDKTDPDWTSSVVYNAGLGTPPLLQTYGNFRPVPPRTYVFTTSVAF
jgi:outer membrane receptor protein involved in Fe transport